MKKVVFLLLGGILIFFDNTQSLANPNINTHPISPQNIYEKGLLYNLRNYDSKLANWIRSNVSEQTSLPLSFDIRDDHKMEVYQEMGGEQSVAGIIERTIVEEGLIVYDGAVSQIVLSMIGSEDDMKMAQVPIDIYWKGSLGKLSSIRTGYPNFSFVYDPLFPEDVSSNNAHKGKRGFIFRIINANGQYTNADPLDGKTQLSYFPNGSDIHWEDWKPVAGENAWVAMAALHIYHKKYFDPYLGYYMHNEYSTELKLAKELARAAMKLQSETGGIRMAPLGTYRNVNDFVDPKMRQGEWWYNQISSENNISWYSAFRMLYQITEDLAYKKAMDKIEGFYKALWNNEEKYFYQGLNCVDGKWVKNNDHFALDVQTWGIGAFGPAKIDRWFGEGTSYLMWKRAKEWSGSYDGHGRLKGVGYIKEHDRVSVEWTAGAIMAARDIGLFYRESHPEWSREVFQDADLMRHGIEELRQTLSHTQEAYSYSSRRGWIPFGWNSHNPKVVSLASTGWVMFVDAGFNPFYLNNYFSNREGETVFRYNQDKHSL